MSVAKIRFAKQSDMNQLINLCKLHALYERAEYNDELKLEKLNTHLFSHSPSFYCLVVEFDGELIGYASYMKQFSTWDAEFYIYMDCLFLKEESRGLGLGVKLIDRIKAEAKKLECNLIQWQTPDFNTRAISFYQRIGAKSKTKERFFLKV